MTVDTTKTVTITGGNSVMRGGRPSRKKMGKQQGGSHQSNLIISKFPDAMAPSSVPCDQAAKGYQAPTLVHGAPLGAAFQPVMPQVPQSAVSVAAAASPLIPQMGGKVVLRKAQEPKKVHLVPKQATVVENPAKKRKRTRKVMLGLVALKKRQTRARHITDKVKEVPLEQLKAQLVEKGLIKPTSKAPESVLRQIAGDAQIVAGYGL